MTTKTLPHRHVADASWHMGQAGKALERARDEAPSQAAHDALDSLARGQRSARRIVERVFEHFARAA